MAHSHSRAHVLRCSHRSHQGNAAVTAIHAGGTEGRVWLVLFRRPTLRIFRARRSVTILGGFARRSAIDQRSFAVKWIRKAHCEALASSVPPEVPKHVLKLSFVTRHPVFSSVKRVFRLPKGATPLGNILCKATPSEQDGLQRGVVVGPAHGVTSSREVTRPRPEAAVPVQTVAEVPRGPKVPDTETAQARVEVSEDHEPLRPSAPNICPDSQDSPGLCAIHPGSTLGSPSRPAHRGQMKTGKWTDLREERG